MLEVATPSHTASDENRTTVANVQQVLPVRITKIWKNTTKVLTQQLNYCNTNRPRVNT